jgi:hypothetical protein
MQRQIDNAKSAKLRSDDVTMLPRKEFVPVKSRQPFARPSSPRPMAGNRNPTAIQNQLAHKSEPGFERLGLGEIVATTQSQLSRA